VGSAAVDGSAGSWDGSRAHGLGGGPASCSAPVPRRLLVDRSCLAGSAHDPDGWAGRHLCSLMVTGPEMSAWAVEIDAGAKLIRRRGSYPRPTGLRTGGARRLGRTTTSETRRRDHAPASASKEGLARDLSRAGAECLSWDGVTWANVGSFFPSRVGWALDHSSQNSRLDGRGPASRAPATATDPAQSAAPRRAASS
jgi:hypothetical protein